MNTIGEYTLLPWVPYAGIGLLGLVIIGAVLMAISRGRTRKRALSWAENASNRERLKDKALFLAALVPSLLVWLAVMGVSFIGLTGFARDVMHWNHWTNMLVPLSLDGISVSFGAWAFVAVKRGRHPGRSYKIVLAAATMSAVLNFVHGRTEYSIWAGGYLAFLSFAGMAMFHELLDQFMAQLDDDALFRGIKKPRFGERWLWAPVTTFQARKAWIVYPVPVVVKPTIGNSLKHLERVQEALGKKKIVVTVTYTEDQLSVFPDGVFPASGPASRRLPEAAEAGQKPASRSPNGSSGAPSNGLPYQANGHQKPEGTGNGRPSEKSSGGFRQPAFDTSQKSVSEEDQILHLVTSLRGNPGLTVKDTQALLGVNFYTARERLSSARERIKAGNAS